MPNFKSESPQLLALGRQPIQSLVTNHLLGMLALSFIGCHLSFAVGTAHAQPYWGNFPDGGNLYFWTNTVGTDGAPETPASEAVDAYKNGTGSAIGGVTINDDNTITGQHLVTVDTDHSDYTAGNFYTIYYSVGTVDGVSVVGRVIGSFYLGPKDANVTHISGDDGAANALEAVLDGTGANVTFKEFAVTEGGSITTTDTNESALAMTGNGTGNGVLSVGGGSDDSAGISALSNATNGFGIYCDGNGTYPGLQVYADGSAPAAQFWNAGSGYGFEVKAEANHGVVVTATGDNHDGIRMTGGTLGDGIQASGGGGGVDIRAGIYGNITGNLTGSVGSLATQAKADVRAEANGAIEDNFLDQLLKAAADAGDIVNNSVIAKLASKSATAVWTSYDNTTDSLEAQRDRIDAIFDGAPTFAEAMDAHEYTSERALKIDKLAPSLLLSTTINGAPVSQTEFAIENGPADEDALNGALVIVTNNTDPLQKAVGLVKNYDESSQTVTLISDPGIFDFGDDDQVDIIASGAAVPLWLANP